MPHSVESTITLSERDLSRGAVDLTPEVDLPVNNTLLETAVSVVREAAPKIVEAITNHLVPTVSRQPDMLPRYPEVVKFPQKQTTSTLHPEVMFSPPLETVVVVTVPVNHTSSTPVFPTDTVCCN
jgi:hypothetical protein